MAAAFARFWASMELRRASYSLKVRAVSWIPARAASEEEARVAAFARSGRIIRSCSAVAHVQHMLVCRCAGLTYFFLNVSEGDQHHFGLDVGGSYPRLGLGTVGGGGGGECRH